jgi:hypothetical protein
MIADHGTFEQDGGRSKPTISEAYQEEATYLNEQADAEMPPFLICTHNLDKIYRKGSSHSGWPYIETADMGSDDSLDMLSGHFVFARAVFSHRKKKEEFIPCRGARSHYGSELHHYEILRVGQPTDWNHIQDIVGNNKSIDTEIQRAQVRKLLDRELIKARIRRPPLPLLMKDIQVLAVCGLINRLDLLSSVELELWRLCRAPLLCAGILAKVVFDQSGQR